jgi:hypothetical protein
MEYSTRKQRTKGKNQKEEGILTKGEPANAKVIIEHHLFL